VHVGPDNGLLVPAAERFGGIAEVRELTNPDYALQPVSRTFHGRDVFAPAAAHLARGVALAELGPPLDPDALVRLDLPQPEVGSSLIRATVLYVDLYGNVALNLRRDDLEQAEISPGSRVELETSDGERYFAVAARTFADARDGDIVLYEDSYRSIAVAINKGDAASMLGVSANEDLLVRHPAIPPEIS
jgi:S-adenosyl-L-methionine hydrolase (adenosine-forming)